MNGFYLRATSLVFAGVLALAGCQGSKGDAGQNGTNGTPGNGGPTGPTGPTGPGGPGGIPGVPGVSTGLKVEVLDVSRTAPISVRFTMKDDRGYAVDIAGGYSINTVFGAASSNSGLRFALAYVNKDASQKVQPYTVLTNSGSGAGSPSAFNAFQSGSNAPQGTLVQNAAGEYTYTFPTTSLASGAKAVAYDATALSKTHVLWIQATRQTNLANPDDPKGFTAVNQDYWFVPDNSGTPEKREIVKTENCSNCHRGFATGEGSVSASFHGGGRVDARFCGICHNPGRTSNPSAEAKVFVHRLHNSENLQQPQTLTSGTATSGKQGTTSCTATAPCTCTDAAPCTGVGGNLFHGIKFAFPQDIRNCNACHGGTAHGAQATTNPSRAACGSCHDYVSFTAAGATACVHPPAKGSNGDNATCNHTGGTRSDDTSCTGCHGAAKIAAYHLTVVPPDPNNVYLGGKNANTNAAWLAAANALPEGAKRITYDVALVDTVAVTGGGNPRIKFRFLVDGTATPMQTYAAGTTEEILPGFVGSPSVYFAWAQSQDGIGTPADFNASASAYVRNVWNGKVTTATLTGPDADQYYTVKLNNVIVPTGATMLTGGLGYTYGLGSATNSPPFANHTLPLTQINVPAPSTAPAGTPPPYPYTPNACPSPGTAGNCGGTGGLIVPAPNKWKVATGFTGRRAIVETAKCQTCHVALGAAPSFHAGQRNDGPTCSFCHTPNRTSSGWSANAKGFIHAIHAARMRHENGGEEFNWHAAAPGQTYGEVEFPGPLNNCTACHVPGGFNFTAAGTASSASGASQLDDLLPSTVAQGRFNKSSVTNPTGYFSISPYVAADNVTDYGYGFSTSNVNASLPDGMSGTQTVGGSTVTCTQAAPCICTAANPCSVNVSGPYTVNNVPVNFTQKIGTATNACNGTTPCTCTTAQPCSGTVATCSTTAACEAQATTLVISPIAAACVGCHDSPVVIDHMQANGGKFYEPRSSALSAGAPREQCMLCHGPNSIAPIADVHR